jgi:hypothetical protein
VAFARLIRFDGRSDAMSLLFAKISKKSLGVAGLTRTHGAVLERASNTFGPTGFRALGTAAAAAAAGAGLMPRTAPVRPNVGAEVKELEARWTTTRWDGIVRPYTPLDVIALRGSLRQTYASETMAQKLYATLVECKRTGGHSRTFGALDPVQAVTMAPKLTSIYVSGWQSSSTASTSNEPGPGARAGMGGRATRAPAEPYGRRAGRATLRAGACAARAFVRLSSPRHARSLPCCARVRRVQTWPTTRWTRCRIRWTSSSARSSSTTAASGRPASTPPRTARRCPTL